MKLSLQHTVSIRSGPLYSEVVDSIVVMDVNSGRYFSFENVAREIWKALADPIVVGDLCDRLAAEYDAPSERIQASVLSFLEELRKHDLISVDPALAPDPVGP